MHQKRGRWYEKYKTNAVGELRTLIIAAARAMVQPTGRVTIELESKETKL